MRRVAATLCLALGAAALGAEEFADTHPAPGPSLVRQGDARVVRTVVPGVLLDWAAPRVAGGRQLYLLAAPEGARQDRRALYRLDLAAVEWTRLGEALPRELDRLAARDLDGDGTDELLIGGIGMLYEASVSERFDRVELRSLFAAPGIDLAAEVAARRGRRDADELLLPAVGALHRFATSAGKWSLIARRPLPTSAERHGHGLRLTTPSTTLLRSAAADRLAVGPVAVGHRRLRSELLPVDGGRGLEIWSRLPTPERLQWSWFDVIDGRPVLIVTTNSADRVRVLERQALRLFALYADRTREGVGPWLEAETTSRRWQRVEPFVADLEGDGDDDLVVAQTDGLGGGETVLEAFVNSGRRGFEARRRRSVVDLRPDGWHFGDDLSGDGLPDLVLLSDGDLAVFAQAPRGRRLLTRRPLWSFPGDDMPRAERSVVVGAGGGVERDERRSRDGRPVVIDLDGDGRAELVLAENPRWGFGRLRVVFLGQ